MKKPKRKLEYIVRVTTHRHLKGEHRKKQDQPKLSRRKLVDGSYKTEYHEGDVIRSTKVYYFKNRNEIREHLERVVKKFKRSKQNDISIVTQLAQGNFSNRYKGKLRRVKGNKITKSARMYSIERKKKATEIRSKLVSLDRDISKLDISDSTDLILRSRRKGITRKKHEKKKSNLKQRHVRRAKRYGHKKITQRRISHTKKIVPKRKIHN